MDRFAALDDSMYLIHGIYIYSHALITKDDKFTILFSGKKEEVYSHEPEILEFILDNLPDNNRLYSCRHYTLYPSIWNLAYNKETDIMLPRETSRLFRIAHETAKNAARTEFEKIKKAYAQSLIEIL
ncbi:MAG: hypothetical protein NDI94_00185 [Candidatus Woesearchaeota archaeon]|nr:hypothetical protein [Candidatus Woesearchaeota archaeon]